MPINERDEIFSRLLAATGEGEEQLIALMEETLGARDLTKKLREKKKLTVDDYNRVMRAYNNLRAGFGYI